MTKWFVLLLIVSLSLLESCSSLRKSVNNENRIVLNDTNFKLIEGKYRINSVDNKGSFGLTGFIFSGGYKLFKSYSISKDSLAYVRFEILDKKTLIMHYTTNDSTIKSTKIKGKLKDGYFVLKQSHVFLPFIFTNMYRNRQFRIGLLNNGNLITDHNQISLGTVLIIIPFYDNDKSFDVEFKRIRDDSEPKSPEEYPRDTMAV